MVLCSGLGWRDLADVQHVYWYVAFFRLHRLPCKLTKSLLDTTRMRDRAFDW